MQEDSLTATTTVNADVVGLAIGRKPRLTVGHLTRRSQRGVRLAAASPPYKSGRTPSSEVAVNGHNLIIELDLTPFQRCDTHAKLMTAADDQAFVREAGRALFMQASQHGHPAPGAGRLLESYPGAVHST